VIRSGSGRAYRDVRFRADKSPYKTEIYATLDRGGYVRFGADGLTAATGYFRMSATQVERYRHAVDREAGARSLTTGTGDALVLVVGASDSVAVAAIVAARPSGVAPRARIRSAMLSLASRARVDDLVEVQVQVAEVMADDVPVRLLALQVHGDQVGEKLLQIPGPARPTRGIRRRPVG
jgi:hypothetical protein